MICQNCGAENIQGGTFCVKCGSPLTANANPVNNEAAPNPMPNGAPMAGATVAMGAQPKSGAGIDFKGYFTMLYKTLLKPKTTIKENIDKYSDIKNAGIFAGLLAVVLTLVAFLGKLFQIAKPVGGDFDLGRFSDYDYSAIKIMFKYFLEIAGIILIVAGIYYLVSLIFKKQVNFSKVLTIAALALVPYVLCEFILSPVVLRIFYKMDHIRILITAIEYVGTIYGLLILLCGVSNEVSFDGDKGLHFHFASLGVIALAFLILSYNVGKMSEMKEEKSSGYDYSDYLEDYLGY